jgi:hypothetical protein
MKAASATVCVVIGIACAAVSPVEADEGPAGPLDAVELAALIDRSIEDRLEGLPLSPAADDAQFVRRLYLDLHGIVPTVEQTLAFLHARESDKRARLVDALLDDPAYGRHLADLWDSLLLPVNSENRKVPIKPLNGWLARAFQENRPWNEIVHEMLTAVGPQNFNPAVTPFMANAKSLQPHEATDLVTRLFLGVRLECAQCHNHPFDRWKQADYWGLAAFIQKITFTSKFDDLTLPPRPAGHKDIVGTNYGITEVPNPKKRVLPERALPSLPRLLTGEQPQIDPETPPLRPVLAAWLTSPENPWFAQAMANRVWGQLFGRGLVNPVDDLRADNPPTHPELLEDLARQFAAHDFDLKYLFRAICLSGAYQRSSQPVPGNAADDSHYSRMIAKVLTPEQMFDSLTLVLGEEALFEGKSLDDTRQRFVEFFSTDDEPDAAAYRRGIPQLLKLMNHAGYQRGIAERAASATADRSAEEAVEQLYLLALSRRPSEEEVSQMLGFMREEGGEVQQASVGILWVLLNSSEFALNR